MLRASLCSKHSVNDSCFREEKMKKIWIALISAAAVLAQLALTLVTGATGILYLLSIITAVTG